MKQLITGILLMLIGLPSFAHKTDSVGTKVKDGKVYILHKVEKGQGMYSISKKYDVSLQTLVSINPGSDKIIKEGQLILIPTKQKPVLKDQVVKEYFDNSDKIKPRPDAGVKSTKEVTTFAKKHVVKADETLYSISKKYNTSVEMIKSLNSLKTNDISLGQTLLVQDGKAPKKVVKVVDEEIERLKKAVAVYKGIGVDTMIEESVKTGPGYTIKIERNIKDTFQKVEESGTALIVTTDVEADKYHVLHFNAPIGTVVLITNPTNQQSIFAKVQGNFTKKHSSSNIVKLSQKTASEVGIESNGRVEISYALDHL